MATPNGHDDDDDRPGSNGPEPLTEDELLSFSAAVLREIFAERERQIDDDGFDAMYDADHGDGQLCCAAMGYCQSGSTGLSDTSVLAKNPPTYWPWQPSLWKPKTARRDLIRAAALIVAEIERSDRLR